MCVTICTVSGGRVTSSFFEESIFVRIVEGRVDVREVYDVFFTPRKDMVAQRLLCISPHDLLGDGDLAVEVLGAPGSGTEDDKVYAKPLGCGHAFDHKTRQFAVGIRGTNRRFAPTVETFAGETITPQVAIPPSIDNERARAIMHEIGTVFELRLPDLSAGTRYAMRLVIQPYKLLGLSGPQPLEFAATKWPIQWTQHLSIWCPKSCHYNVCDLLRETGKSPSLANDANAILALVDSSDLQILMSEQHRILLILPPGCELGGDDAVGCNWRSGTFPLQDSGLAVEWAGGTKHYWTDDIECVSRRIWEYLSHWSKGNPKPVEFLTTALNVAHENCALVVDGLAELGALELVDQRQGLYKGRDLSPEEQAQKFEALAVDPRVKDSFKWMGYEIRYWVRYRYLSRMARAYHVWTSQVRPVLGFWLAVAGVALGTASILLAEYLRRGP